MANITQTSAEIASPSTEGNKIQTALLEATDKKHLDQLENAGLLLPQYAQTLRDELSRIKDPLVPLTDTILKDVLGRSIFNYHKLGLEALGNTYEANKIEITSNRHILSSNSMTLSSDSLLLLTSPILQTQSLDSIETISNTKYSEIHLEWEQLGTSISSINGFKILNVGGSYTSILGVNYSSSIGNNYTEIIQGQQSIRVLGSPTADSSLDSSLAAKYSYAKGVEVLIQDTFKREVDGTETTLNADTVTRTYEADYNTEVKGTRTDTLDVDYNIEVSEDYNLVADTINITGNNQITLQVGSTAIRIRNGAIYIG